MRRTLTILLVLSLMVVGSLALAFGGGLKPVLAQTDGTATASISGTVTDKASGGAISGAWVFYWSWGDNGAQAVGAVTADSSGKYSIAGVPQGRYMLTAVAVGYQPQRQTVNVQGDATADFALTKPSAPPTGTLSGKVADADSGNAIAEARVQYVLKTTASQNEGPQGRSRRHAGMAKTDDSGAYSVDKLLEGTYSLTVGAKGYVPQTKDDVTITAGQTATENFALTKVQTGTVSGTVKDEATGEPIAGARVILLPTSPHLGLGPWGDNKATSDESGSFTISDVPEGTYRALVQAPGYRLTTQKDVEVKAGATATLDFSLEAGGGRPSWGRGMQGPPGLQGSPPGGGNHGGLGPFQGNLGQPGRGRGPLGGSQGGMPSGLSFMGRTL